LIVLVKFDFEDSKLITAVSISGLVGTDSSKHNELFHLSVILPSEFRFLNLFGIEPAVVTGALNIIRGSCVISAISIKVDGINSGEAHKRSKGKSFHLVFGLSINI